MANESQPEPPAAVRLARYLAGRTVDEIRAGADKRDQRGRHERCATCGSGDPRKRMWQNVEQCEDPYHAAAWDDDERDHEGRR